MLNKTAVIVDMNNRAWASFHAYSRLSHKGQNVAMMYGLPSMVKYLIKEFKPDDLFGVWDGARSAHRLKLHPEYKGNRKHKALVDYEDFLFQKAAVMNILHYLGVRQVLNPEAEADDIIYKLTRVLEKKGYKQCIIVSGDKDFHQLIRPSLHGMSIKVYSESKKELIDWHNCHHIFGYKPYQTVDYLTLLGDDSDNIPGYRGIGEKKAADLLNQYGSLAGFLQSKEKHSVIQKDTLLELIKRNKILIDLRKHYELNKKHLKVIFYKGKSNPTIQRDKFLKISAKYGMNKFMSSGFLNEFKSLKK